MKKLGNNVIKITDPEILCDEFIKIGFKETTYEELKSWKEYGIEYDRDPRWKIKMRIYQLGDLFWAIFERDNCIYSCKGFGWPQPKNVQILLDSVLWRDDDYDYDQF
jgi:hypothetical protein